ncbi:MAG TPA: response regulator [Bdellovibrionales bacterium]|nr:response regulator [Bdellovibrionales bacterium]
MDRSQIKVLIVDDDATFSEVLRTVVTKAGFQAIVAKNPADAIAANNLQVINAYVIDCLLPKMPGIDLAQKLRNEGAENEPIILTSGIYKDKAFIKEALQKTKANQFFPKPFDPLELIKTIESGLTVTVEEPKEPFAELLSKPNATPGEKLAALKATTVLHGFDLPRALTLLMMPSVTGKLYLTDSDGKPSVVSISRGRIVQAELQDRQSFFGALIVEKNFLTLEKLDSVLSQPNPNKLRVGERLITANVISPHVISIINTEQLGIRLSQLVQDTNYEVKFEEVEVQTSDGAFERVQLVPFLSDWISSKITLEWLKNFYLVWQENTISRTDRWSDTHPAFNLTPLIRIPELRQDIKNGTSLMQLMNKYQGREEHLLGSIHLMILNDLIVFNASMKSVDSKGQIVRLQRILKDLEAKNLFEILGVSRKVKGPQIKKAYHDLSKAFHPDKLQPGAEPEVIELTKTIFAKMTAAYNQLSNDVQREAYVKELEHGQAEKVLQAESLFEEGKSLLKGNQPGKAVEKFKQAAALRPANSELILHTLWAQLNSSVASDKTADTVAAVGEGLNRIAPEDRHNFLYYFVKGLWQKHLGDLESAKSNLSHSVALKPEFLDAKRELHLLSISNKNKPVNLLHGDLKDVVGLIFGKKK